MRVILGLFLLFSPLQLSAYPFIDETEFLTEKPEEVELNTPAPTCSKAVLAWVDFPTWIKGTHDLQGRWIRPDGELFKDKTFKMRFNPAEPTYAQFWMQFGDNSSYDGSWAIEIYIADQKLVDSHFTVVCQ